MMKHLWFFVGALALAIGLAPSAGAQCGTSDVPDPTQCTVTPCDALHGMVLCPPIDASGNTIPEATLQVTIKGIFGQPLVNAKVEVDFPTGGVTFCSGAQLSGCTNANGNLVVPIRLLGRGCRTGSQVARVKVNGVPIREYTAVKGVSGNDFTVNLSDITNFSSCFGNPSSPCPCFDYNNDNTVNLSDLIIISAAFNAGAHCPW